MVKMLIALVFLHVGVVLAVVSLNTLFMVQSGNIYPGSCDDQLATLNAWLAESASVIQVAQDVMGFYNEPGGQGTRGFKVRQAMHTWFKIRNRVTTGTGVGANNINGELPRCTTCV